MQAPAGDWKTKAQCGMEPGQCHNSTTDLSFHKCLPSLQHDPNRPDDVLMRSRIHFTQFQMQMYKDRLEWQGLRLAFLENVVKTYADKTPQLSAPPVFNIVQENNPTITQSVVGSTPEERQKQSEILEALKKIAEKHPDAGFIAKGVSEAQEELKKMEPDPARFSKVLEQIKYGIKAVGLLKELKDGLGPAWYAIQQQLGLHIL